MKKINNEKNKLQKIVKIIMCIDVVMLVILIAFYYYKINQAMNTTEIGIGFIGAIGWWMVPYMLIELCVQIVIAVMVFFNKKGKVFLHVISIILEAMYLIFGTILNIPLLISLGTINRNFAYTIMILFELFNISLFILMIINAVKNRKNYQSKENK